MLILIHFRSSQKQLVLSPYSRSSFTSDISTLIPYISILHVQEDGKQQYQPKPLWGLVE